MEQAIYHNEEELLDRLAHIAKQTPLQTPLYVIVPDGNSVEYIKRKLALTSAAAAFGTTVTTLRSMAEERYALFGGKERLAETIARVGHMAICLQETAKDWESQETVLPTTPGSVQALLRLAEVGSCYPGFQEAVFANRHRLASYEALARYFELLHAEGLFEYGMMLAQLLACEMPVQAVVIDPDDLLPLEVSYLEFHHAILLEGEALGDLQGKAPEQLTAHLFQNRGAIKPSPDIRFALADGIHVEQEVVARAIEACVQEGFAPRDIYVVCGDQELYGKVLPLLADRHIPSTGSLHCPLNQTVIGRAYIGLRYLAECLEKGDVGDGSDLMLTDEARGVIIDVLSSPCASVPDNQVYAIDEQLARSKSAHLFDGLQHMKDASDALVKPLVNIRDYKDPEALRLLIDSYTRRGTYQFSQRRLAEASLELITKLFSNAHIRQVRRHVISELLVNTSVETEVCEGDGQEGYVTFGELNGLRYNHYPCVIFCNMTADIYSMEEQDAALRNALGDLGFSHQANSAAVLRKAFKRGVSHACNRLVFQRAVRDADAEPLRPSALFEDVCDCFREDVTRVDDLDDDTGMPLLLLGRQNGTPITMRLGEECLPLLFPRPFGSKYVAEDARKRVPWEVSATAGQLSLEQRKRLFPPDVDSCLSASQVEAYLKCPYRWFVENKVHPQKLGLPEETLGIGLFAHEVLEQFYQAKAKTECKRVTPATLIQDVELFDEVFDDVLEGAAQNENIPLRVVCRLDIEKLKHWRHNLKELIKQDSTFLPDYQPAHLELSFGQDKPLEYAGHLFRGRIDRLDINRKGQGVIIDYKGSVGSEYSPKFEKDAPPSIPHAQALIYAQIAKRSLGINIVGSLYRSYKGHVTKGAADANALQKEDVCSNSVCLLGHGDFSFDEVLNQTEEFIAEKLEDMMAGRIPKAPAFGQISCQYCPVVFCDKREE